MDRGHPSGTFWPSAAQQRLLAAALGDPERAVEEWRALQPSFSLDDLEPGSFEAMPLVYRNLSNAGLDDPDIGRLKGIYRRAWVKNNFLAERTRDMAAALEAKGIRSLFLEGPAVALRYYGDLGLRPTSFVHVLVDERDADGAREVAGDAGWLLPTGAATQRGPWQLTDREGQVLVLRTAITYDFVRGGEPSSSCEPFWSGASRQDVNGHGVLVPAPGDMLLAVCASGARRASLPNIQWILDAALVIRYDGIDWSRFSDLAIEAAQTLRVRAALDYLATLPVPSPPAEVGERLRAAPVSRRQRIAYALAGGALARSGPLPEIVAEHLAATAKESPVRVLALLPERLRDRWNLDHTRQLPLAAGRRAWRLAGGRRRTA